MIIIMDIRTTITTMITITMIESNGIAVNRRRRKGELCFAQIVEGN